MGNIEVSRVARDLLCHNGRKIRSLGQLKYALGISDRDKIPFEVVRVTNIDENWVNYEYNRILSGPAFRNVFERYYEATGKKKEQLRRKLEDDKSELYQEVIDDVTFQPIEGYLKCSFVVKTTDNCLLEINIESNYYPRRYFQSSYQTHYTEYYEVREISLLQGKPLPRNGYNYLFQDYFHNPTVSNLRKLIPKLKDSTLSNFDKEFILQEIVTHRIEDTVDSFTKFSHIDFYNDFFNNYNNIERNARVTKDRDAKREVAYAKYQQELLAKSKQELENKHKREYEERNKVHLDKIRELEKKLRESPCSLYIAFFLLIIVVAILGGAGFLYYIILKDLDKIALRLNIPPDGIGILFSVFMLILPIIISYISICDVINLTKIIWRKSIQEKIAKIKKKIK